MVPIVENAITRLIDNDCMSSVLITCQESSQPTDHHLDWQSLRSGDCGLRGGALCYVVVGGHRCHDNDLPSVRVMAVM